MYVIENSDAASIRTRLVRAMEALMPSMKRVNDDSIMADIQVYDSVYRWFGLLITAGIVINTRIMLTIAINATKIAAAFGDFFPVK